MADSMPSVSCPAPSGDVGGQCHDLGAFEALFRTHYAPLCDFVYGYVRSRAVAHPTNRSTWTNYRYQTHSIQRRAWDDKMYFRPISRDELNRNSMLKQNPGF